MTQLFFNWLFSKQSINIGQSCKGVNRKEWARRLHIAKWKWSKCVVYSMGNFLFYKKKLATALGSYSWLILNSHYRGFKCDSYWNDDSSEVAHLTVNRLVKTKFNMNGLISRGRILQNLKQPLPVSAYKIQVKWARRESKQFLDIIRVLTCVTFSAENSELLQLHSTFFVLSVVKARTHHQRVGREALCVDLWW